MHRHESARCAARLILRASSAQDIGFGGWRLDFVKGFAPEYTKEYIMDTIGPDHFHVAELWTDMHWEGAGLGANQDAARQARTIARPFCVAA